MPALWQSSALHGEWLQGILNRVVGIVASVLTPSIRACLHGSTRAAPHQRAGQIGLQCARNFPKKLREKPLLRPGLACREGGGWKQNSWVASWSQSPQIHCPGRAALKRSWLTRQD